MTSITATTPAWRTFSSMTSLRNTAMTAAGTVAAAMSQASRRSGSPLNDRSRIVAKPAGMSRRQSSRK